MFCGENIFLKLKRTAKWKLPIIVFWESVSRVALTIIFSDGRIQYRASGGTHWRVESDGHIEHEEGPLSDVSAHGDPIWRRPQLLQPRTGATDSNNNNNNNNNNNLLFIHTLLNLNRNSKVWAVSSLRTSPHPSQTVCCYSFFLSDIRSPSLFRSKIPSWNFSLFSSALSTHESISVSL